MVRSTKDIAYETVGFRKSATEFFRAVLNQLDLGPENVFMVGDDFETDVLAATAVGIGSVWLNMKSRETRSGHRYTTALGFDTLGEALEQLGFCRGLADRGD